MTGQPIPDQSNGAGRFPRVGGRMLFARHVDLKRTANDLGPASDGLLMTLWSQQTDDARWAWEGLWVGLVRNGWDGFFTLASDEERVDGR